jgi:ribonuclease R
LSIGEAIVYRNGRVHVKTPEGDYLIVRGRANGAMGGDKVEVVRLRRLERQYGRPSGSAGPHGRQSGAGSQGAGGEMMLGAVRRVLVRAHTTVVGVIRQAGGLLAVVPESAAIQYDIFVAACRPGLVVVEGDIVLIRITTYPTDRLSAQGHVEELIGHEGDDGLDVAIIIRRHGFETEFGKAALEEARLLAARPMGAMPDDGLPRRDLRDKLVFTIDPADAHDFDDALSIEREGEFWRLGVHIADVSAFVRWDSAIDIEARRRATSVYLPGRVIPMLPEALSNGLCSLRPDCERLTFTADMLLAPDGSILHAAFYPSLIKSFARLTYDEALQILDEPQVSGGDWRLEPLRRCMHDLDGLARVLAARRRKRGAIDFDGAVPDVTLGEDGRPSSVGLRTKTASTALVEESMILANEAVASRMLGSASPMVYRVHEAPSQAALEDAAVRLESFGLKLGADALDSHGIQGVLDACAGDPKLSVVSAMLLRAMKRAEYRPQFTGHFGLASAAYTHFTSPIRRYPDLLAHRMLKLQLLAAQDGKPSVEAWLEGRPGADAYGYLPQLKWLCEHSSAMEREAESAASEAVRAKICEYYSQRTGMRLAGVVSVSNSNGIVVREDATLLSGHVDMAAYGASYIYEEDFKRWTSLDSRRSLHPGQPVTVILKSVDQRRSELIFALA